MLKLVPILITAFLVPPTLVHPQRNDCPGRIPCPLTGEMVCLDRCPLSNASTANSAIITAKAETADQAPACCAVDAPVGKTESRGDGAQSEPESRALSLQKATELSPRGRVDIYAVPLVCPAAPEIGCGSRAKPVLRALEAEAAVEEAWLNRAGTRLAVVWSENSQDEERSKLIERIAGQYKLSLAPLDENGSKPALDEFRQRFGWYRGEAVDRLSEEEAGIIAGRLVSRVHGKSTLSEPQQAALHATLETAIRNRFLGQGTSEFQEGILQAAGEVLDDNGLAALKEALNLGLRPTANEP